jgi:hypothetical protein
MAVRSPELVIQTEKALKLSEQLSAELRRLRTTARRQARAGR